MVKSSWFIQFLKYRLHPRPCSLTVHSKVSAIPETAL